MSELRDQLLTSAADLPWAPKHPGHFIKVDILEPHGLTQENLGDALHVHRRTINELVGGKRELTVDMARRLSEFTGLSAEYWRELQTQFDLWRSRSDTPSYGIRSLSEAAESAGQGHESLHAAPPEAAIAAE